MATAAEAYKALYADDKLTSVSSVARAHNVSISALHQKLVKDGIEHNTLTGPDINRKLTVLHRRFSDLVKDSYKSCVASPLLLPKFPCRVIFLDDCHFPFVDYDVLRQVVERESGADYLVTHELINYDGFSKWTQEAATDTHAEEVGAADLIGILTQAFGHVVVGHSNHMARVEKLLKGLCTVDQQEYLLKRLESALQALAGTDEHVTKVPYPMVLCGDAAFAHFDDYAGKPGDVAQRTLTYLTQSCDVWGVGPPRAAFVGHTHRIGCRQAAGAQAMVYEVGSCAHIQDYAMRPGKLGPARRDWRQACGYGYAVFDKLGRVDLSESGVRFIKWATLPNGLSLPASG